MARDVKCAFMQGPSRFLSFIDIGLGVKTVYLRTKILPNPDGKLLELCIRTFARELVVCIAPVRRR